jgi:hypothetical protein
MLKVAGVLVIAGLLLVAGLARFRTSPAAAEAKAPAASITSSGVAAVTDIAQSVPPSVDQPSSVVAAAVLPVSATASSSSATSGAQGPAGSSEGDDLLPQRLVSAPILPSGTLAVSSAAPAEIYIDDQYVGSTPASLQMSPGTHTVEYRFGERRKTLTHIIGSSETTKATVTFDIQVLINANPWANVFLDGSQRKLLGQTPLSGIEVPIGSVLVFEHPQFPPKRYRVTGNETGIRIALQ